MSDTDNLAFHAQAPGGGEGFVILLFRPDAEGRVRFREWPSSDYVAPGREGLVSVEKMTERIEGWVRTGWKLTESPIRIAHWLGGGA